jgi:hypothetical protein
VLGRLGGSSGCHSCSWRDVGCSGLGLSGGSSLLVSGSVGEELFECGQALVVVFGKISTHTRAGEESLHVFAGGSEIEDVVSVVSFDAVGVLKELVGLLFHHGLLCCGDVARARCRRGHEQFVSGAVQECSCESPGEFLGTHHQSRDIDLTDGLHFSQYAECVGADTGVAQDVRGFRADTLEQVALFPNGSDGDVEG